MALEWARVLSLKEQEPESRVPMLCEGWWLQSSHELLQPWGQEKEREPPLHPASDFLNEGTVPDTDEEQGCKSQ